MPRVKDVAIIAAPLTLDLGGLTSHDLGATAPRSPAGDPDQGGRGGPGPVHQPAARRPPPIHWHGISLRNDMDGVPGMTQQSWRPAGTFTYEFTAPDPGTFWFHPHVGLHLDRGLYAPLIVEDPAEPGRYDREYVVVLDDWTDGVGQSPEAAMEDLRAGRGPHAAHQAGGGGPHSDALNSAGGDVSYPLYLLNGRHSSAPVEFAGPQGRAHPPPDHQRRRRHALPGGRRRAPDDGHPRRRLPGRARAPSTP